MALGRLKNAKKKSDHTDNQITHCGHQQHLTFCSAILIVHSRNICLYNSPAAQNKILSSPGPPPVLNLVNHYLCYMPLLGHDTNKPERSIALVLVLVPGAGRNIGIGAGFHRGVLAIDMQAAMAFEYIIDVRPLMGVPGAVPAFRQFDHPHDISIPALLR